MKNIWDKVKEDLRKKAIPIDVILELTRQCNVSCCHCYNFKDNAQLSFDQVKVIARQLRQAGTLFISLTGGEVFTHPDFFDICFYLRNSGFDLKIFTNGTLINENNIKTISKIAPSEVGISIQGAVAKTHDAITGSAGSFNKSINAIKLLKKEDISVNLKCTLMKDNFSEYRDVIKLAQELDTSYIVDPVVSPRDDGSKDVLSHRLDEPELEAFYQDEMVKQLGTFDDQDQKDEFTCPAGTVMASISAGGDVYPCIQLPERLGNVFEKDFKDIWENSQFLNKMRKNTNIEQCNNCKMLSSCTRCPGLAYLEDGDAFGISSIACINASVYEKIKQKQSNLK